jgi:hypothetical protein
VPDDVEPAGSRQGVLPGQVVSPSYTNLHRSLTSLSPGGEGEARPSPARGEGTDQGAGVSAGETPCRAATRHRLHRFHRRRWRVLVCRSRTPAGPHRVGKPARPLPQRGCYPSALIRYLPPPWWGGWAGENEAPAAGRAWGPEKQTGRGGGRQTWGGAAPVGLPAFLRPSPRLLLRPGLSAAPRGPAACPCPPRGFARRDSTGTPW